MRLLLDNNLSYRLVDLLESTGHDMVHVRDLGLGAAADQVVLSAARDDDRVLVSADTDFGMLLARSGSARPSIILLRIGTARRAPELARLLLANLGQVEDDLRSGAIVVIGDRDIRVRPLPIPPGH